MFLVNQAMQNINPSTAALVGLMGYLVVFVGLIFLMAVVVLTGNIMVSGQARKKAAAPVRAPQAPVPAMAAASGSAGMLKLFSVPDKDAAILMAIVADRLGKPLNELRFKSIKEV